MLTKFIIFMSLIFQFNELTNQSDNSDDYTVEWNQNHIQNLDENENNIQINFKNQIWLGRAIFIYNFYNHESGENRDYKYLITVNSIKITNIIGTSMYKFQINHLPIHGTTFNVYDDLFFNFLNNKQVQENDLLHPNNFNGEFFLIKFYNNDPYSNSTNCIVKIWVLKNIHEKIKISDQKNNRFMNLFHFAISSNYSYLQL
jgi:hypothetical protein